MTEGREELPIPDHYEDERAGELWRVDYASRFEEAQAWRGRWQLRPASEDRHRIGLMAIDLQNTFCLPDFELAVDGAVGDLRRFCRYLYRHLDRVTEVVATLDTHHAVQIFHPPFLVNREGQHPPAMTPVSLAAVEAGEWSVAPDVAISLGLEPEEARRHLLHYCRSLSRGGKFELMVWPFHAMLGGVGHALVAAVEEAIFFHSIARSSAPRYETKGRHPLTENYSVLRPEVLGGVDGEPLAAPNRELVEHLLSFDALVVAGQAKSHCVAWTLDDLAQEIEWRDPSLFRRIYLLEDCTSPVVVPGVADFTASADAAFERFSALGMHRVRSTTPLAEWPEFPLS